MDLKLLFLINREWIAPWADWLFTLLSSWGAWFPLALVLIVILLIRGGFRARAFVLTAAAIVGINDGLIAKPLKKAVNRPRPHQIVDNVRMLDLAKAKPRILAAVQPVKVKLSRPELGAVEGRSFPSSHTVNTFSVALIAVCFYGWRAWWTFLLAAGVGYSRIYTGAHWPSDVLISMFIGLGMSLLLLVGLEALWRRRCQAVLPRVHAAHPSLFSA